MASSSSSSSSSPFRLHPQWKYENDVYVNSGEDVLDNFSSHLLDAFRRESVKAFPDERLQKGAETMPELFKAIKGSKISVIIFSNGYPFSESCMRQLAKIMECQKQYQIVIPVFYEVLPSDVRWQEGSFGEPFAVDKKNLMPGLDLDTLKADLVEASNLAGWDSKATRPEATLVQAIVNDIVKKLESIADSMVKELESLFGSLCDKLECLPSSFLNNIELKHLYCKVKEVHYLLENADRYRSYPYWSLCHLFTDLRNLTCDVQVLIDDKANSERQFSQAVEKIDQWLLRFLDSVNNLVACHDGKRSPIFQQPVPRTATYARVEAIASNNSSLNLSRSNSRFKEAIFMLEIDDDDEARKKAFSIVSQFQGIKSITFGNGKEGNKLTVIGCNLDAISIGKKLGKLCHTELVFFGSAKMPEEMGEEPEGNHEVTDQLVKAKKASKFPSSLLSRMCISFK